MNIKALVICLGFVGTIDVEFGDIMVLQWLKIMAGLHG